MTSAVLTAWTLPPSVQTPHSSGEPCSLGPPGGALTLLRGLAGLRSAEGKLVPWAPGDPLETRS